MWLSTKGIENGAYPFVLGTFPHQQAAVKYDLKDPEVNTGEGKVFGCDAFKIFPLVATQGAVDHAAQ